MTDTEDSPGRTQPETPDPPEPPLTDKPAATDDDKGNARIYKYGFYVLLALATFSSTVLFHQYRDMKQLVAACGQMQSKSEQLMQLSKQFEEFSVQCSADLKTCAQDLEKADKVAEDCVAEMRKWNSSDQETLRALRDYGACQEQLIYTTRQNRLESNKLAEGLEQCVAENAKLQKKLLHPCPGM